MYYALFDTRPKHSEEPYLFHDHIGKLAVQRYAIYRSKGQAEEVCNNFNSTSKLTTYVVKELNKEQYAHYDALEKWWKG